MELPVSKKQNLNFIRRQIIAKPTSRQQLKPAKSETYDINQKL